MILKQRWLTGQARWAGWLTHFSQGNPNCYHYIIFWPCKSVDAKEFTNFSKLIYTFYIVILTNWETWNPWLKSSDFFDKFKVLKWKAILKYLKWWKKNFISSNLCLNTSLKNGKSIRPSSVRPSQMLVSNLTFFSIKFSRSWFETMAHFHNKLVLFFHI